MMSGFAVRHASAQAAPLLVEADEVTFDDVTKRVEARGNVRLRYRGISLTADQAAFDLQTEVLTARGRVVFIDVQGRELHGEALTYDVRLELAEVMRAEAVVDRVFVRSERVQAQPRRIVAEMAMLTTCDPSRPVYRITARRVEITPGERLVARDASLWLGRYRVLTLPVYVMSLRSPGDTARSLPRVGYNHVDGLWVDYTYGYNLGAVGGALTGKIATRSGFAARNTLTYRHSPYIVTLTTGRNQNVDLVIFDQVELAAVRAEQRIAALPMFVSTGASAGWYRESDRGVQTTRLQYQVAVRMPEVRLGPRTVWYADVSWQDAHYGTGARQGVLTVDSSVRHDLTPDSWLLLRYRLVDVLGGTPFAFDAVSSPPHTLALYYTTVRRSGDVSRTFVGSALQDFRSQSFSLAGGYSVNAGGRYHGGLSLSYNLTTRETSATASAGTKVGRSTYASVSGTYNIATQTITELEFVVTSRICDCIEVSLRYRPYYQSRAVTEIWLEIGVLALPESRLQFYFPSP